MKEHSRAWSVGILVLSALTDACNPAAESGLPSAPPAGGTSAIGTKQGSTSNVDNDTGGEGQGGGSAAEERSGGASFGGSSSGNSKGRGGAGGTSSSGKTSSGGGASAAAGGMSAKTSGATTAAGGTSAKTSGSSAKTGGASAMTGGAGGVSSATGGAASSSAKTGGASTGSSSVTPGKPSSGCSVTDAATGTAIDGTISVGSAQRTYRLSVPTDYDPSQPYPLVFALNGVGGTGKQAQSWGLEANHRAIFIYPDPSYNDSVSNVAWFFEQNGVDVAFFDALIKYLTGTYCIDMDRIFSLGVSSGAIMSNMLGCFRGDVLRAIAPASGMTWSNTCKGDVAVMVICGATDSFNPCDDAKNGGKSQTDFWAPQNKCGTQTTQSAIADICSEYQGCTAADPVLLCKHPGGHMWPGGEFWWQFFMSL